MAKQKQRRADVIDLDSVRRIDRTMDRIVPLVRQFVVEVMELSPERREPRIARLVSALSDVPSGEIH